MNLITHLEYTKRKTVTVLLTILSLLLFALQSIPLASELNNSKNIRNEWLSTNNNPINQTLIVSAEKVAREMLSRQDRLILIDIRRKELFEKIRIPGSINIPLFAIKTKTFLKPQKIILVNEGYGYRNLLQESEKLNRIGFNVKIMDGGIYYWLKKEGKIEGDLVSAKDINTVPPAAMFNEKGLNIWLILDVSRKRDIDMAFKESIHIPFGNDLAGFVSSCSDLLRKTEGRHLKKIIIYNENGEDYEKIEKAVLNTPFNKVFFLQGGMERYLTYCRNQFVVKSSIKKTSKKNMGCLSCLVK